MALSATLLALTLSGASVVAADASEPRYPWASSRSLFFGHVVERSGFHVQVAFGVGGGPENEGLFHAMEVGGTFQNGVTLALLHTFTQNKGIIGPERGPDLIGGWMAEVKAPLFFPEFVVKLAAGLGGLHDQSDGIRAIPGFGLAWGFDVHVPFFRTSGLTVGVTGIHAWVPAHYFTCGVGLGYTFF
jgi:hypothetical protein